MKYPIIVYEGWDLFGCCRDDGELASLGLEQIDVENHVFSGIDAEGFPLRLSWENNHPHVAPTGQSANPGKITELIVLNAEYKVKNKKFHPTETDIWKLYQESRLFNREHRDTLWKRVKRWFLMYWYYHQTKEELRKGSRPPPREPEEVKKIIIMICKKALDESSFNELDLNWPYEAYKNPWFELVRSDLEDYQEHYPASKKWGMGRVLYLDLVLLNLPQKEQLLIQCRKDLHKQVRFQSVSNETIENIVRDYFEKNPGKI